MSVFSYTPKAIKDLFQVKFEEELSKRSNVPFSDMLDLGKIKSKINKEAKHSDIKKSTLIKLLETFITLIPDWESALEKSEVALKKSENELMNTSMELMNTSLESRVTSMESRVKGLKILEMESEKKAAMVKVPAPKPVEKKNEGCQVAVSQKEAHCNTEDRGNKRSRKQTCVFFKKGICKFGPTGHNAEGTCSFQHPSTCPSFELFGWKTRWGCKKKNCRLLHRICCRKYMSCGTCDLEKGKCLYYHPPELKNIKWLWKDRPGRSPPKGQEWQGINVEHLILSLVERLQDGTKEHGQIKDGSCLQVKKGSKNPRGK